MHLFCISPSIAQLKPERKCRAGNTIEKWKSYPLCCVSLKRVIYEVFHVLWTKQMFVLVESRCLLMISSVFSPLGCILLFFKTQFLPRTFGISKHLLRFQESVKSSKFKDHVPLKFFYVLRSTYVHKNKQLVLRS